MSKLDELKRFTAEVKRAVVGKWDIVFRALLPSEFGSALDRAPRHVTCPFHGGKNDFRFDRDYRENGNAICTCGSWDGFKLIMQARGWDFPTAVDHVGSVLGGGFIPGRHEPTFRADPIEEGRRKADQLAKQQTKDAKVKARLVAWWSETVPLTDPMARPARLYFKNRKLGSISLPICDIGYHPGLEYFDEDGKSHGAHPCIVAIVRMANGQPSTVHRTWITLDGQKAPVPEARKQYSNPSTHPVVGAAIKFDVPGVALNVGEGIESILAARAISGIASWSCLNKQLMRSVIIPEHVRFVTIWADRDRSGGGQTAAIELMDRLKAEGRKAVVMLPPYAVPDGQKSIDWNDVVKTLGLTMTRDHTNVVTWRRKLEAALEKAGFDPKQVLIQAA